MTTVGLRRVDLEHPRRPRHRGSALERALVDCGLYCGGVRVPGTVPLEEAAEKARSSADAFVWLGLHEPDADAFTAVAQEFGLHALAVEDAVVAHQRPKLDVYDDHLFAVLKTVRYVDTTEVVETGELMVFVGADFVVTVRHGIAAELTPVRQRLEQLPEVMGLGPSAVLWAVADAVVDDYAPALDGLESDVDEVEDQVFAEGRGGNPARRIYTLKREVMEFGRAVHPLVDVTERLARAELSLLSDKTAPLFRDVHDHVLRADERVTGLDGLLQSSLEANVAQVTLQQNEDMRKITAWVAILSVCTLIAGIYGMNFRHMPELGWTFGYPGALSLMVGIAVSMYRAFRRNDWL
ncbi:MAG: putative ion transport protein [Frankiales bacterium]|nr:putative ion transport protein [Frankiales bacterium]